MKGGTEIQKDRSIIADERFREDALTKNTWELVLKMGLPLAFYEMLNSLYKILDSLMASHINASSVSTIAYLAQISILISAVGQGLSVGGGLKIRRLYPCKAESQQFVCIKWFACTVCSFTYSGCTADSRRGRHTERIDRNGSSVFSDRTCGVGCRIYEQYLYFH